jgi:energy-coupling factor transporter ATP-binding protein EcfA2
MQLLWYLPSLIIGLTVGFSSGYWQLALVSILMVSLMLGAQLYKNRYPVFEKGAQVFLSAGQVAINNRVLPRFEMFWKKQWHELILESFEASLAPDLLASLLAEKSDAGLRFSEAEPLEMWLGSTGSAELRINLKFDGPHLIIVGPTGSGKSELLKLIASSLVTDQKVDLVLFDYKGGATLEQYLSCSRGMGTDLDPRGSEKLWESVLSELASREALFAKSGVSDLARFNALGNQLRSVVVIIDEFAAVLASGQRASSAIEDVCARGRSLGVHLVAATQSLTGIPRSLMTNLRARIAMSSSDPIDFVQLGINPNNVRLPLVSGWAQAVLLRASGSIDGFYFPIGFRPVPKPAPSKEVHEPLRPVRSQLLRQMYLSQEPAIHPPAEQLSTQDSQLLSRMEGLRLSVHK